jgi:hypothetical protein
VCSKGLCPRGDLNSGTGDISLIMDLNSKTGEKSPDRGVHAVMVAGEARLASSRLYRLAAELGLLIPAYGTLAGQAGASAVLPWRPAETGTVARLTPRAAAEGPGCGTRYPPCMR